MKTKLLLLLVLAFLLCLPSINKAVQTQDSLNPCWKMVIPDDHAHGYFNPDSVMYDSCLCTEDPRKVYCEYEYAKQWFGFLLPYHALYIPRDSIIDKKWQDIDTNYTIIRDSLQKLENIFGGFIIRKEYPDDIDSFSTGSRYFRIKFDNYIKIDTVSKFLRKINGGMEGAGYENMVEILAGNVIENKTFINGVKITFNNDYLDIYLEDNIKINTIEIFTILGKIIEILERTNYYNEIILNISNIPNGIYFLKINDKIIKFIIFR